MTTWNPYSPGALGLQWRPLHEVRPVLSSLLVPVGALLESSTTETVDAAWFFAVNSTGSAPEAYQVDIFEDGVFPDSTDTEVVAYPSSCPGQIGAETWNGSVIGVTNQDAFVDSVTQTPVTMYGGGTVDDDFLFNHTGHEWFAGFTYDGLAASLAGKHIISVRQTARFQPVSATGEAQSMTVQPYMIFAGITYFGDIQTVSGTVPGGHLITYDWWTHPKALRGWQPADLAEFDVGVNTAAIGWFIRPTGSSLVYALMFQTDVRVRHAGTDQREAFGSITLTQQVAGELADPPGWFRVVLQEPDATPGWPKAAGVDYRVTISRLTARSGGKQVHVQTLSGPDGDLGPINGWSRLDVKKRSTNRLPYSATAPDDGRSGAPTVALEVAGAVSLESQPYAMLDIDSLVYTGVDFRQYFTTPGTLPVAAFPLVRALLGRVGPTASGDLTIRIRRAADGVQLGSTITVTPEDFEDDPDTGDQTYYALYKTIIRQMATAATLATSTQYYFHVQSDAAEQETGWRIETARAIPGVFADTPPTGVSAATFGGVADRVVITGSSHTDSDACLTLMTLPVAPTNLTAQAAGTGCIRYAQLDWDTTALGADHAYYQLQRRDEDGDWADIATIEDEAVTSFDDYELRRGREAEYRLRVVRVDTAPSEWTATATATVTAPCCGYVLTTNQEPGWSLWADDWSEGERETELAQAVELVSFYDRDYQVGFFELENRGAQMARTLVVAVERSKDGTAATTTEGLATFADLLRLCRPTQTGVLPYVCVHEETGDRWFATIKTPKVKRRLPGGLYTVDVEIIEVTATPSPVVVPSGS